MTRPYPPPSVPVPVAQSLKIDSTGEQCVARTLGLTSLSPEITSAIAHAVACYKATMGGSPGTTNGGVLAALKELSQPNKGPHNEAVSRAASHLSGLDYTTHHRIQPLALAVDRGDGLQSVDALSQASRARADEMTLHPRIDPGSEALKHFCGMLKLIFDNVIPSGVQGVSHNCLSFAREVFLIGGIETADFDAHPDRLKKYLQTDVTLIA